MKQVVIFSDAAGFSDSIHRGELIISFSRAENKDPAVFLSSAVGAAYQPPRQSVGTLLTEK